VISRDSSIDPVGACVGMRGSRVQAVVQELQGEKIDIIPWSPDQATFIVNALAPAEVTKVVLDDEGRRVEVVVPDDQLSLAIGRRGQNVRLASQLTRYDVDILTEAEESERRQEDFRKRSGLFVEGLDVDDVIAGLLVTEGFGSIEDIVNVDDEELAGIEGFDENISAELKRRASAFLERRDGELDAKRRELGVEDAVAEVGGFSPAMLVALGEKGVKSLEDLADLAGDELVEILGSDAVDEETANAVIMAARQSAGWFGDEDVVGAGAAGEADAGAAEEADAGAAEEDDAGAAEEDDAGAAEEDHAGVAEGEATAEAATDGEADDASRA
jgi:N utilization substance protein A